MRNCLFLLSLAAFGFAPAPVYRERPADAVLRRLQGGWRGVSYTHNGQDFAATAPFRLQVEKGTWRYFTGTPLRESNAFAITLDTKAKPMRIDWRERDSHVQGVFELSGDKIRYSFRQPNMGCPASLAAPGPLDYVIEAVREK